MENSDWIATGIDRVNRDFYISALKIIEQMIRMLAPHKGARILEIGTCSGYSTAILSHLVGKQGKIISIDIERNMVERASRILQQDERNNVSVFLGDGKKGFVKEAPYNKIIAWASAEQTVPPAIVKQLVQGFVVCPIRDRDNSYIASFRKNVADKLIEIERIGGGFIPMIEKSRILL